MEMPNDADLPKISIVVPVRNAERTIETTIKYILAVDYPRDKMEIIFADGDSTDTTVQIIQKWQKDHSFIRFCQVKNCKSPGEARNAALEIFQGDFVLFTDGDCAPEPDWAKEMIKPFLADDKIGMVGGEILTLKTEEDNLTESYCEQVRFLSPVGRCGLFDSGYMPNVEKNHPHEVNGGDECPFFATANASVSRAAAQAVGNKFWDEPTGEDVDFNLRVMQAGYKLYFNKEAVVKHMHRVSLQAYRKQWHGYGFGHPLLLKSHARHTLEIVLQIFGWKPKIFLPFPIKGIIHLGAFHLMRWFFILTILTLIVSGIFIVAVSGQGTLFTILRWLVVPFAAVFTTSFLVYFFPVLKLKPTGKLITWMRIRYATNRAFYNGANQGTKKFGTICKEPSW